MIVISIGLDEILLILVVGFVVVGPKDLPKVARTLAQIVKKARKMLKDINKSFEAEMEIEELKDSQEDLSSIGSDLNKVQQSISK